MSGSSSIVVSAHNRQALALIASGDHAPVIHDDCGTEMDRVDLDCPCPLLHFRCPVCRAEQGFEP